MRFDYPPWKRSHENGIDGSWNGWNFNVQLKFLLVMACVCYIKSFFTILDAFSHYSFSYLPLVSLEFLYDYPNKCEGTLDMIYTTTSHQTKYKHCKSMSNMCTLSCMPTFLFDRHLLILSSWRFGAVWARTLISTPAVVPLRGFAGC